MDALVIYDSKFGNTKRIAEEISETLKCKILNIKEANQNLIKNTHLLIVGSPTQGGRPTKDMIEFLNSLPSGSLEKINAGVFDTRLGKAKCTFALKIVMNILGFAAEKMGNTLKEKGAALITGPQGYIVEGGEGPLSKGEIERARQWALKLSNLNKRG